VRISRSRLSSRVRASLDTGCLILTAGAGCGKTTAIEQALADADWPVAWVTCSAAARSPGLFVTRIVSCIATAVPGSADAVAEAISAVPERIDALGVTRELVADLARLLVEPLVVVVDDGEQLDGAAGSLEVLDELFRAEIPLLRVAVASRRPLALRVARSRAAGRVTELSASDLAFDAEECAELLRRRTGTDPATERVEEMMRVTEGWPLGIALAAGLVERAARTGDVASAFGDLRSAADLRSYLSEELVDSLDPELRRAAVSSSVVPVVTERIERALGLGDDFEARVESAGLLVRPVENGRGFVYHPLLREHLLDVLHAETTEADLRALHAAVAPALDEDGEPVAAIEHWLAGHRWAEAVAAIEREGLALARTAPELIPGWLATLPEAERAYPTMRALEGQLHWRAGQNEQAIVALQDAIDGFRERPNPIAEWASRSMLVDLLFATHAVDGIAAAVEGWDAPAAAGAAGLAPAVAMYGATGFASFARFEESERLAEAAKRHRDTRLLPPFEALQRLFIDLPRGRVDQVCEQLDGATRAMEHFDPLQRRRHILGVLAIVYADRGDADEALRRWIEVRDTVRGRGAPLLIDAAHAWCAVLHTRAGRLAEAEEELAQLRSVERSARSYVNDLAPAAVAALRGDADATLAAAERTLDTVAGGPILFRYWAEADLVPLLADVGLVERARRVLAGTLAVVDEHYPGELGSYMRARLLGLRAWLNRVDGSSADTDGDLVAACEEAGDSLRYILRRDWQRLEPVLRDALERGAIEPGQGVAAVTAAFPDGRAMVGFLDHPVADVRLAALPAAVRSGDPRALSRLEELAGDEDERVAAAATRLRGRLSTALPPLRFQLLGGFAVRRGGWLAGEAAWVRPVDARLVRHLLVRLDHPVPEDDLMESLWPGLPVESARRSLQVAASRARRVLDPPGAEASLIQRTDGLYRLVLGPADTLDADEFARLAGAALAERGEGRRQLLERARAAWGGEPLPEERYSDWATAYREALTDRYTAVLSALVELDERAGDHARAADTARELVELDALNEGAHRALMTAYARAGRTGHALRQYLECRRALVEALGIEPAEATSRLQARILAGEPV
jgi:DNA-binding SARP family transcriptional activator/tetratricopeptide (TPR) repeat protein